MHKISESVREREGRRRGRGRERVRLRASERVEGRERERGRVRLRELRERRRERGREVTLNLFANPSALYIRFCSVHHLMSRAEQMSAGYLCFSSQPFQSLLLLLLFFFLRTTSYKVRELEL